MTLLTIVFVSVVVFFLFHTLHMHELLPNSHSFSARGIFFLYIRLRQDIISEKGGGGLHIFILFLTRWEGGWPIPDFG